MKTYSVTIETKNNSSSFTIDASNLEKAKSIAQFHKRMEMQGKGKTSVRLAK